MLTHCELLENPVVLTVGAGEGLHTITAERLRGGRMRLGCSCVEAARQGWCMHGVRLLCLRYDEVVGCSRDETLRFEEMVAGTALAETADEIDLALADFEAARQGLERAAPAFEPAGLHAISAKASDLADAALQLDRAIVRFKRRLSGEA